MVDEAVALESLIIKHDIYRLMRFHLYYIFDLIPVGLPGILIIDVSKSKLVDKDPEATMVYFWKGINVRDKVDSALKDMAFMMKQLDRTEEAIEAIKFLEVFAPKILKNHLKKIY
ncbi:hypothetical protein RYX36_035624 [Vicia faba]